MPDSTWKAIVVSWVLVGWRKRQTIPIGHFRHQWSSTTLIGPKSQKKCSFHPLTSKNRLEVSWSDERVTTKDKLMMSFVSTIRSFRICTISCRCRKWFLQAAVVKKASCWLHLVLQIFENVYGHCTYVICWWWAGNHSDDSCDNAAVMIALVHTGGEKNKRSGEKINLEMLRITC
jgi:hypothetical protein